MTAPDLQVHATALELARQAASLRDTTEQQFLNLGNTLIGVNDRFDALERPIRQLGSIASSDDVHRVVAGVRHFEASLRGFLASVKDSVERLVQTGESVQRMRSEVHSLSRVIRTMNIVSVNARVTVASISNNQESLTVFTRDAAELVDAAFKVLDSVEHALEGMTDLASTARISSFQLSQLLDANAASGLHEVLESLQTLEAHLTTLTAKGGRLAGRAHALRDSVGACVMALQAGDALRQRLDHICTILDAVTGESQDSAFAALLLVLARQQLRDANDRHAPELASVAQRLRQAGDDTLQFLRDIDFLFSPDKSGVTVLQNSFLSIEDILFDAARLQGELKDNAQKMLAGVTRIHELVDEISKLEARMNLIGINAVIACTGLGNEGLPLKEISRQLRDLVDESARHVSKMHVELTRLKDGAHSVSEQMDAQEAKTYAMFEGLQTDIEPGLLQLRGVLVDGSAAISQSRAELHGGLSEGMAVLNQHETDLRQLLATSSLHISTRGWTHAMSPAEQNLAEHLREILSIASEREVHDLWARSLGAPERARTHDHPDDMVLFDQAV